MLRGTCWLYNGSSYTDLSDYSQTDTSFNFISASTDYFYIGLDRRFTGFIADLSTQGSYTGLSHQYYNGTTWKVLPTITAYNWNTSKYMRWTLPSDWIKVEFTSTFPSSSTPPDTDERYWIRISCTAVATQAVISKLRIIPYVLYSTPQKVSDLLTLKKVFDEGTTPKFNAVEDFIRRAEDKIDYRTKKSWRANMVTEENDAIYVDYNRYGIYLRNKDFFRVYSLQLWNGSNFEALIEGRDNDYFMNMNEGMIYITRLYMQPAMYSMTGRYQTYGWGEYKNSVKVDYIYGRNWETAPEYYIVEGIATKLAAIEVMRHADYTGLIVSGSDKVTYDNKIRLMTEEIETDLDSLTGIAIF